MVYCSVYSLLLQLPPTHHGGLLDPAIADQRSVVGKGDNPGHEWRVLAGPGELFTQSGFGNRFACLISLFDLLGDHNSPIQQPSPPFLFA